MGPPRRRKWRARAANALTSSAAQPLQRSKKTFCKPWFTDIYCKNEDEFAAARHDARSSDGAPDFFWKGAVPVTINAVVNRSSAGGFVAKVRHPCALMLFIECPLLCARSNRIW